MISVTVHDVTKKFGDLAALDRINLKIEAGELFFLLGPSGCGKTTLLRTLAGFHTPDAGRILFGEEDVTRMPPHKRNTGMMFQSYALWPHLSVERNVAFGLEERRVPRAEVRRQVRSALASVRMESFATRNVNQLSGGEQQRVALARAMVIRPRCLLLDEPLSNLDAKLRLELRGEIRRVCKENGLTAIYVTHDQKEALSVADRLAILSAGRVLQIGKPAEVYRHPHSRFVADFIGETNFLPGQITEARAGAATVSTVLGEFKGTLCVPSWQPAPGAAVLLSIRPESWLLKTDGHGANTVAGRIVETVYLGEMAQYRFSSGGQALKLFELNPRFIDTSGDRDLFATVEPADVIVLPEE